VASDLIDEPEDTKEPSSPACLAHEADDAYMGFASRAEIAVFMKEIAGADAEAIREMLPRIRDDVLYKELAARLQAIELGKSGT
jgi:hypothetical protein